MIPARIKKFLKFFASLKLAVLILIALAAAMSVGTVLESRFDTATAQYYVYRAPWFHALLTLLGVLIAAVMVDRWPWKKRQIPFLMAHIGILMMLFGSWLTDQKGLDGWIRINEGETSAVVEINSPTLSLSEKGEVWTLPIQWLPPDVQFKPFALSTRNLKMDLRVTQFLSHADPNIEFLARTAKNPRPAGILPTTAIQVKLSGGPMRISQEIWLWAGAPAWSAVQAGPAWLGLESVVPMPPSGPRILFRRNSGGGLSWDAFGSSGEKVQGKLTGKESPGTLIQVPWRGGVQLKLQQYVEDAYLQATYKPSRIQYGDKAPLSAIEITAGTQETVSSWLGIGDRTQLTADGRTYDIAYGNKRVLLPFAVRLDQFKIDYYEGTSNPSEYSSKVTVIDGRLPPDQQKQVLISMNEPLEYSKVTLYQSSYEEGNPRPTVSIFSVNQDPGRPWKYWGSILIVLGTILLFAMKYWKKRQGKSA